MIYEYKCKECDTITQVITNNYELKTAICRQCGKKADKILSTNANRNKPWAKECRNVR